GIRDRNVTGVQTCALPISEALRVVRKDGTVRLDNELYEVDLALRGLAVRLRFDPWSLARVHVDYRGQSFGLARKVDRHLNSQLRSEERRVGKEGRSQ